jgi:hypothetical protein
MGQGSRAHRQAKDQRQKIDALNITLFLGIAGESLGMVNGLPAPLGRREHRSLPAGLGLLRIVRQITPLTLQGNNVPHLHIARLQAVDLRRQLLPFKAERLRQLHDFLGVQVGTFPEQLPHLDLGR